MKDAMHLVTMPHLQLLANAWSQRSALVGRTALALAAQLRMGNKAHPILELVPLMSCFQTSNISQEGL